MAGDPVLYVVACGGRAAGDLVAHLPGWQESGWQTCVVATPSALKFMDAAAMRMASGHVMRWDYKQPDEPDVLPPPDAIVVAPATFNTINKMASGASDTLALGILNEAIGLGLPMVAVPTPNVALARHPERRRHRRAGTALAPQARPEPACAGGPGWPEPGIHRADRGRDRAAGQAQDAGRAGRCLTSLSR